MFTHKSLEFFNLTESYDSLGRVYTTPNGDRYPSVTTVLGLKPKPGLIKWREHLGDEEADRIMKTSANLGTEFHSACEDYISNKEVKGLSHGAKSLFRSVRGTLNKNVDNVLGMEIPLYSDVWKLAGRSDLIAHWKNQLAIIDYKNSRNEKPKRFCEHYFHQGVCYGQMIYEMYGIVIKKIVIIIAVWGSNKPIIYEVEVKDYYKDVVNYMKEYHPLWRKQ